MNRRSGVETSCHPPLVVSRLRSAGFWGMVAVGILVGFFVVGPCVSLLGCTPARDPSTLDLRTPAAMRAVLVLESDAVYVASRICAAVVDDMTAAGESAGDLATLKRAVALADDCANTYHAARDALLVGEATLDAWEEGKSGNVACAAGAGLDAIRHVRDVVGRVSPREFPGIVDDALRLAPLLLSVLPGQVCELPPRKGGA